MIKSAIFMLLATCSLSACEHCKYELMERLVYIKEAAELFPDDSENKIRFKGIATGIELSILLIEFNHVNPGMLEYEFKSTL